MTSTVLDVALCLLLVSAAAATLVTVPDGESERTADARTGGRANAVATTLTTSTTTVNYSLEPGAARADDRLVSFPTTSGPEFERSSHGTYAGLLADAAVGGLSVDGEPLTHADDGFRDAIRTRTESDVAHDGVQLLVRWEPYRGAHLRGCVTAGPSPPSDATVHAATVTVPSGLAATRDDARVAATESGFAGVASVVAANVVEGLFPADDLRFALRGDYPVSHLARYRYLRAGERYGVAVVDDDGTVVPAEANERLTAAVADAVERDLERSFETPSEAAASVRVAEVQVVVRTWSV
ncbi:hypothetical protein SAMN04487950_2010 [Halogranum rubrum]|uniref:Uncharacterized protein n=1 Tax=Halogranum rubrum TaxID=553466 RepID=A0A1I4EBR8_9EURY|nr:hypothetical protein [Halogranum rubrum]SFL02390.1 hypothetical protein SAMN04487950_2010 [Halogranum rubrum]